MGQVDRRGNSVDAGGLRRAEGMGDHRSSIICEVGVESCIMITAVFIKDGSPRIFLINDAICT